jgi:tetratricopeptide (TPR) repeat protein
VADLFAQARALVDRGDPDSLTQALPILNDVITVDPLFADAYLYRGRTYALLHRLDFALDNFDQALRLDPDMAEAYFFRATIHHEQGNPKSALADYEEYLATDTGKRDRQRAALEKRVEELRKEVGGGRGGLFRWKSDR